MRFGGLNLLAFTTLLFMKLGTASGQEGVCFPWGCDSGRPSQSVHSQAAPPVYKTLGKLEGRHVPTQPVIQQPLPPQQIYAYGWFGSNPSPIWGRHFGNSKSYTQWTQR